MIKYYVYLKAYIDEEAEMETIKEFDSLSEAYIEFNNKKEEIFFADVDPRMITILKLEEFNTETKVYKLVKKFIEDYSIEEDDEDDEI